ncbi:MAG: CAP domain-containing protein [Actinobacteria bacterium]|nr:CAP domain-containing protein [Actinomycetota bacterium]
MRSFTRLLLALAVLSALTSSVGVAAAASTSAEEQLAALVNAERTKRGLRPLSVDTELGDVASHRSDAMVSRSKACPHGLAHAPGYEEEVPPGWMRVGENVGCGGSVAAVHQALMGSPTHRDNILGDFEEIGIGVETDGRGSVWITELFATYPVT